jgi:hypothetical protein
MAAVPGILRQWNPGIVPNLQLWVDGSDKSTFTFTNESNINTFRDKSGNGVIFTQGTQSNQPIMGSNINGRQSISFPPNVFMSTITSNFVSKLNSINNTEHSQFSLFKLFDLNSSHIITYMGNTSASSFQQIEFDTIPSRIGIRVRSSGGDSTFPNIEGMTCNILFTQNYYYGITPQFNIRVNIDNDDTTTGLFGYNITNYDNFYIGKSFFSDTVGESFNGDLGEIIIFTSNYLSHYEYKSQIEGYLAWKWGLQSLLLNDHPYKNRAPT